MLLTRLVRKPWRAQHLTTSIRLHVNIVAGALDVLLAGANLMLVVVRLVLFVTLHAITHFTLITIQMLSTVTVLCAHNGSTAIPQVRISIVALVTS